MVQVGVVSCAINAELVKWGRQNHLKSMVFDGSSSGTLDVETCMKCVRVTASRAVACKNDQTTAVGSSNPT
jgi:hypothetical protein